MGYVSDNVANGLLDYLYGAGANGLAPATYYMALSLTTPSNTGANVTEPGTGAYARVALTNNVTNFPTAANRMKSNGAKISFPSATGTWGTVYCWCFYDHATATGASNFRGWGALDAPISVSSGKQFIFATGAVVLRSAGS